MKIGIVGLGSIGGSLGLDLRAIGHRVLGVGRRAIVCEEAKFRGIADSASVNLSSLATTDIVFICTPLGAIIPTIEELIPHLSAATIVTDVGSVKTPIVKAASAIWPNFVGGHPMAGTAESGLDAARSNLFIGNPYVVTPVETTPPNAVKMVEEIVRSLEAKFYLCSAEDHDRSVAWISHLPVMISAVLIDACIGETDSNALELSQHLASSGFRDTSRVGGGNPELGTMMGRYNREQLLRCLQLYRQSLDEMMNSIERSDWHTLEQKLKQTQQARLKFLRS